MEDLLPWSSTVVTSMSRAPSPRRMGPGKEAAGRLGQPGRGAGPGHAHRFPLSLPVPFQKAKQNSPMGMIPRPQGGIGSSRGRVVEGERSFQCICKDMKKGWDLRCGGPRPGTPGSHQIGLQCHPVGTLDWDILVHRVSRRLQQAHACPRGEVVAFAI